MFNMNNQQCPKLSSSEFSLKASIPQSYFQSVFSLFSHIPKSSYHCLYLLSKKKSSVTHCSDHFFRISQLFTLKGCTHPGGEKHSHSHILMVHLEQVLCFFSIHMCISGRGGGKSSSPILYPLMCKAQRKQRRKGLRCLINLGETAMFYSDSFETVTLHI